MPKEKISDKQFFLIINGPSCGGKSSVSDSLRAQYGNIFNAKYDSLKWLIPYYDSTLHREIVIDMVAETIKVAFKNKFSVISEGGLFGVEKYIGIAKASNIDIFIANIEALWDVLMSRFEVRIEAKKQGAKISNTDPKRFKELYDMYNNTKMETELVFDSSKQSPEEIARLISDYIRKNQ